MCIPALSPLIMAIETMDVGEITPGMKGYGKTVFFGKQIEVFNVEILCVLKNWEARSDMILIMMTGGPLDKTGIISGMSGRPVYIKNKLIGAVSHGWSFAKDAIACVTPIHAMLNVLNPLFWNLTPCPGKNISDSDHLLWFWLAQGSHFIPLSSPLPVNLSSCISSWVQCQVNLR